jgi:hypothetical protein
MHVTESCPTILKNILFVGHNPSQSIVQLDAMKKRILYFYFSYIHPSKDLYVISDKAFFSTIYQV